MWLILLILILILLYFVFLNSKENFIVSYNSYKIPDNPIQSIYDSETLSIQQQFFNLNKVSFDTFKYTLLNKNLTFSYNDIFKISVLNYLKNNNIYIKDSLHIQNNIHDIYFLDILPNRIYIFNCDLVNSTHFFTRNIKVQIKVNNTNNNILSLSQINVLGIILDTDNYANFSIPMYDELYPTTYQIKNTLHLLDPFITSGQDLVLTSTQITNFNNVLAGKSNQLQIIPITQKIG